jgi:hypothetical protein
MSIFVDGVKHANNKSTYLIHLALNFTEFSDLWGENHKIRKRHIWALDEGPYLDATAEKAAKDQTRYLSMENRIKKK